MAMTPQEAFKFGFLLRCAEEGLSPDEIADRVQFGLAKQAELGKIVGGIASGVTNLGLLGLAGSAGIGAGGGYMAAKLTEPDADPAEAKQQEMITAYRLYAEEMARNTKRRRMYRDAHVPTGPRLMR